jgi:hypothetical protein
MLAFIRGLDPFVLRGRFISSCFLREHRYSLRMPTPSCRHHEDEAGVLSRRSQIAYTVPGHWDTWMVPTLGGATSDVAERFRSNRDRSAAPAFFSKSDRAGTWRLLRRWRIATPNEMFGCRRETPAWLIVHRSRQTASECWWSGWVRGRLAVVPISSLRRQLRREIGWTSCRGLHCGRMISGWALDVFQFDCRGKIPYCWVTAGHRCVFLARNYDRAMRCAATYASTDSKIIIQRVFMLRVSRANLRSISTSQGTYCSSYGERTGSVVALTRNSPPPWILFPYRLDRSICRHFAPGTGRVEAHSGFSDLSSSFLPYCAMCILPTDPSTCCPVDVLLGNGFLIDRNRLCFRGRETRAITITVALQTGRVVSLLFAIGQHLGFRRVQFGVVAGFLAVPALGDNALVVGDGCLTGFERSEPGAVAVVPSHSYSSVRCAGVLPLPPRWFPRQ